MGLIIRIKNFINHSTFVFYLLLGIGILSRLYLMIKLPIWHDEFYSIWAANHTFYEITHSLADMVHPPGYYLILYFWGMISQHIYWFRFLSVLSFIVNILLIKKLSQKIEKSFNSNLLIFLYIFSGYFIVFDWQVRMYTLIDTFIFASILILSNIVNNETENKFSSWVSFTFINFLGLYIDYAFIWCFVPAAIFSLLYFGLQIKSKFWILLTSYISACILFVISIPTIFNTSKGGINGIGWMIRYLNPNFYISFFLGSHTTLLFTIMFSVLFIWGLFYYIHKKTYTFTSLIIFISALLSFVVTMIYSYLYKPLFHVRSLQIIGLSIIILYYYGLSTLPKIIKPFALLVFICGFILNFFIVNQILFNSPGSVLIDYFPWRDILNSTDLKSTQVVKYKIYNKLPTPMLLYGLEYTLAGNENVGRKSIKLIQLTNSSDAEQCEPFYSGLMDLYKCKK